MIRGLLISKNIFQLLEKGTLQGLPKAVDAFVMFKPLQK